MREYFEKYKVELAAEVVEQMQADLDRREEERKKRDQEVLKRNAGIE